jgi:zinc protease
MRTKLNLTVLSVLLAVAVFTARPCPAASAAPKVEFEKFTLANGLQVILHVDRKLPIVHVNQWYHVGSKNEKRGRTGFAHLFEHMMFQGSKNAPGVYFKYAEKMGASQNDGVNGSTETDRTNYYLTVPSSALEQALWLESDRLTSLPDELTKERLDNQRDVVKNERRQSLENVPYGRAFSLIQENLFPPGHPYSWSPIGSMEDLSAASVDDVKEFFRTYYTPNNLTLTITGDFDPAEAKGLVAKYFASIPPGPVLDRPKRLTTTLDDERLVVAYDRVPQERVYLVWPSVPFWDPEEAGLDLAAAILGDGLTSRLQKLLVYDKQVCTAVSAFHWSMESAGAFIVVATARPGEKLEAIEQSIAAEIAKLAEAGPTPQELERARNKVEFAYVSGLEQIGGFGGKADQLARYNTYLGNPGMFEADIGRYHKATPESVRTALDRVANHRKRLVLRFLPENSIQSDVKEPDRTKEPAPQPDRAAVIPEVKTATLANGLEVLAVEKRELPKVAVMLLVRGGFGAEPVDKAGLANLLLRTIDRGTKTRSALELEDAFGNLGTELSGDCRREWLSLSFDSLSRHLPKAMEVFADVVLNPAFSEAEVERERKRALDALLQEQQDAERISGRLIPLLGYGATHPYGHPKTGDEKTVKALTPADLQGYHDKLYRPGNAALIFAGDISLDEAKAAAQKFLGAWEKRPVALPEVGEAQPAEAGKIYLVDRPGSQQSVIAQVLPGATRNSPDYYAMKLVDALWGGSFGSRLNMNLREEKGYTYGVSSAPVFNSAAGLWMANTGVQTKVTTASIAELVKELEGITGSKPLTAKELEVAKTNRIRSYSQNFDRLSSVVSEVGVLWAQKQPLSELAAEPVELGKVTLEQAVQVAKKYLVPGAVRLLVVGDAAQIETGLRAMNLGDLVKLDALGNPVK